MNTIRGYDVKRHTLEGYAAFRFRAKCHKKMFISKFRQIFRWFEGQKLEKWDVSTN